MIRKPLPSRWACHRVVGRQEELLPGLLAHPVAEEGLVLPWFQAEGAAFLDRGPAHGQVGHAGLPVDQLAVVRVGPTT